MPPWPRWREGPSPPRGANEPADAETDEGPPLRSLHPASGAGRGNRRRGPKGAPAGPVPRENPGGNGRRLLGGGLRRDPRELRSPFRSPASGGALSVRLDHALRYRPGRGGLRAPFLLVDQGNARSSGEAVGGALSEIGRGGREEGPKQRNPSL